MRALLFALLAGLCWGIGEVFTKAVLHTGKVGPLTAIAARSAVALPFLVGLAWWGAGVARTEPAGWTQAGTPTLLRLVLGSGLVAGFGGMACFYLALGAGEVGRVKPIAFATAPVVGAMLGWITLGESMTVRKAAGIACIVAGIVLLAGGVRPASAPSSLDP